MEISEPLSALLHELGIHKQEAEKNAKAYPVNTLPAKVLRNIPTGPIEGVNFGTTNRIPSDETTQSTQSGSGVRSSIGAHSLPVTPAPPSKADKSGNWRERMGEFEGETQGPPAVVITSPNKSTVPFIPVGSPPLPANDNVMTIDALFERFNTNVKPKVRNDHRALPSLVADLNFQDDKVEPISVFPPSSKTSPKKLQGSLVPPTEAAIASPPPKAPLGEASGANVNTDETATTKSPTESKPSGAKRGGLKSKTGVNSAKGTPNAGKLLKKGKGVGKLDGEKDASEKGTPEKKTPEKEKTSAGKAKGKKAIKQAVIAVASRD